MRDRCSFYWNPEKDCVPRALTIFLLLFVRGVPSTFFLGVRQFPFAAHSWVEWAGQPVQENELNLARFTPIWRTGFSANVGETRRVVT